MLGDTRSQFVLHFVLPVDTNQYSVNRSAVPLPFSSLVMGLVIMTINSDLRLDYLSTGNHEEVFCIYHRDTIMCHAICFIY